MENERTGNVKKKMKRQEMPRKKIKDKKCKKGRENGNGKRIQ